MDRKAWRDKMDRAKKTYEEAHRAFDNEILNLTRWGFWDDERRKLIEELEAAKDKAQREFVGLLGSPPPT